MTPSSTQLDASSGGRAEVAELSGMSRIPWKTALVKIESTPVVQEFGDAYVSFRYGAVES